MVETKSALPKIALVYPSKTDLASQLLERLSEDVGNRYNSENLTWMIETKYYTAEIQFLKVPYHQS